MARALIQPHAELAPSGAPEGALERKAPELELGHHAGRILDARIAQLVIADDLRLRAAQCRKQQSLLLLEPADIPAGRLGARARCPRWTTRAEALGERAHTAPLLLLDAQDPNLLFVRLGAAGAGSLHGPVPGS